MSDEPLPKPVPREQLPQIVTDENHGLWDFFADRRSVAATPEEDAKHGRGWTVEELRHKSWDDLHKLWWVCVKERNRIATSNWERTKSKLGFGEAESAERDAQVRYFVESGLEIWRLTSSLGILGQAYHAQHQALSDGAILCLGRCRGVG